MKMKMKMKIQKSEMQTAISKAKRLFRDVIVRNDASFVLAAKDAAKTSFEGHFAAVVTSSEPQETSHRF